MVESVKAASDVYSPVTGEVVAGNADLGGQPELINSDPYGAGWIMRIRPNDKASSPRCSMRRRTKRRCGETHDRRTTTVSARTCWSTAPRCRLTELSRVHMPFIPHTDNDIRTMLAAIGAPDIDALFEEIPAELRAPGLPGVPPAMTEMEIGRHMHERAARDGRPLNFIGAGAYEHHIPSAVWAIVTRGEFYSAYTPYQAEASQGTLQLLYEYQTMMSGLTASTSPTRRSTTARRVSPRRASWPCVRTAGRNRNASCCRWR